MVNAIRFDAEEVYLDGSFQPQGSGDHRKSPNRMSVRRDKK